MKRYCLLVTLLPLVILPSARADLLGTATNFAVLAGSTVTNTGATTISGNLGLDPGTAVTGFPPGIMVPPSVQHIADGVALQAQKDDTTAYNTLAGLPSAHDLTGQDLGGLTLLPGVYHFDSSAQLTGTLTLNAESMANALFVIQIGSALTTASSSDVQVINGGPSDSVYWQVGSSATLGTSTVFEGNILALTSITLDTSASIPCGRALAQNGAVTLDTNVISTACTGLGLGSTGLSSPGSVVSPTPEPSALLLFATCIAGLAIQRKWAKSKQPHNPGA